MKKVLITGAGSGLGRGTAIGLAQQGHQVIATAEIWPQVTDLHQEAADLGLSERLTVDKLDVLDRRDIEAAMAYDFDTFLSNAAIGDSGPMAEIPVDLVRRTFETNVFGNLDVIQHAVRKWVDAGTRGKLVITSSMGGLLTAYGLGTYCATKHALECIAANLRDELAPNGITVQTINPGAYATGFNDRIAESTFKWHDDATSFTRDSDLKAIFAGMMKDQYDPADMIAKMVEVISADGGKYRTVWPPATEELCKQVQEADWTRTV